MELFGKLVGNKEKEQVTKSIFSPHSYGYRPGRNAHQALEAVTAANRQYDWVIDLDISKFSMKSTMNC